MEHISLCRNHRRELVRALKERGLWKFVGKSAEDAVLRVQSGEFEPLFYAALDIASACTDSDLLPTILAALAGSSSDEDEIVCPVCALVAACPCRDEGGVVCKFKNWVRQAADRQLEEAQRRKLVLEN